MGNRPVANTLWKVPISPGSQVVISRDPNPISCLSSGSDVVSLEFSPLIISGRIFL